MLKPKHHYGNNVLKWNKDKLCFGKELLVSLVPHSVYPKHWHLKFRWRDEKTPEFFNIINARENSRAIALRRLNYDTWESPVGARTAI